jgi:hypothetical protein
MPLEASADNLLLTAMAARARRNDSSVAEVYWDTMRGLAQYVKENGRDPVLQVGAGMLQCWPVRRSTRGHHPPGTLSTGWHVDNWTIPINL